MHLSAIQQATGEAKYTDDLPHFENELYAGLILSTESHAHFTIDSSALEKIQVEKVYIITLASLV